MTTIGSNYRSQWIYLLNTNWEYRWGSPYPKYVCPLVHPQGSVKMYEIQVHNEMAATPRRLANGKPQVRDLEWLQERVQW